MAPRKSNKTEGTIKNEILVSHRNVAFGSWIGDCHFLLGHAAPQFDMKLRSFYKLLLVLAAGLLLASCVSVGDYESENLPWSAPASWENSTIGIRH